LRIIDNQQHGPRAIASIPTTVLLRTNPPRIEGRRFAPPLNSWVLCPKQNLLCYTRDRHGAMMFFNDNAKYRTKI
ncbi:MAG: hypothetical protein ACK400_14260, partial [Pseudanabaena sp.]